MLQVQPGSGGGGAGTGAADGARRSTACSARSHGWFTGLVGRDDLTAEVGLLAVLLAVVLGASHAMLPGHGKTVMAAYLAGRRGTRRDALLVGATVTATHTAGVLVLGLVLTVSTALAPDGVLSWLGVLSGLLVAGIGAGLLVSAARAWRAAPTYSGAAGAVGRADPSFDSAGYGQRPGHGISHRHGHRQRPHRPRTGTGTSGARHGHGQGDGHGPGHGHGHGLFGHGHGHGLFGHGHGPGHSHGLRHGPRRSAPEGGRRFGRGALVGLGVAGGLVPSPTALLVLLGAIGLGRTWFGVGLVLSYGLGMAATLTAAGLLLVGLRDRLDRAGVGSDASHTARLAVATPVLTALLVLVVGLGLAARNLAGAV